MNRHNNDIVENRITVPFRLSNFFRRIMGLQPGRYFIVISIHADEADFTVQRLGKIEH